MNKLLEELHILIIDSEDAARVLDDREYERLLGEIENKKKEIIELWKKK